MLSHKPCIVVICINTCRAATRRAEEEFASVGDQDYQVPPLEEVPMGDQVPNSFPPMNNRDICGFPHFNSIYYLSSFSNPIHAGSND